MPATVPWVITFVALKLAGQRSQAGVHLNHEIMQFVYFDLASGNGKLVLARLQLRRMQIRAVVAGTEMKLRDAIQPASSP